MTESRPTVTLHAEGASLSMALDLPAGLGDGGPYAETCATFTVECGAFTGTFDGPVYAADLRGLRNLLLHLEEHPGEKMERSVAFLDGVVRLDLRLDLRGHLDGDLQVCASAAFGPTLQCVLSGDQTYLRLWLRDLDRALAEFPIDWQTLVRQRFPTPQP